MSRQKNLWMTGLIATALIAGTNVYAANKGLYLAANVGWGDVHQRAISSGNMANLVGTALNTTNFTFNSFHSGVSDPTGVGGRALLGWQYDCHWALEFGWSKFSNVNTYVNSTVTDNSTGLPAIATETGTFQTDAFDFVGKGIYPLPYNFSVYGEFGVAYLWGWPNENATITEAGVATTVGMDDHETRWYPTFGLGVAYDFTPQFQGVLSWNRIQQVGNSTHFLYSTDLVMLGLALHFDTW